MIDPAIAQLLCIAAAGVFIAGAVAKWRERELFAAAVGYVFQPKGFAALFAGMNKAAIDAFLEDRKQMRQGAAPRMELPEAEGLLQRWLVRVTEHLADGRQFLVSDAPTIADFSVYHPLWFVQRAPVLSTVFEPYPAVCSLMSRMAALGRGSSEPMSSAQALAVAASASPVALPSQPWVDYHGCRSGDAVSVMPTDYGIVPVRGDLIGATPERFTLRRHDAQAGELHVHFPRAGYRLMKL